MAFQRVFLFPSVLILLFLNACNLMDGNQKDNSGVVCDLFVKYLEENNSLQVRANFFIEDSLEQIPYFLNNPARLDKKEMKKKLVEGKGLFYEKTIKIKDENPIKFSFQDVNGKLHEKKIMIPKLEIEKICPIEAGQKINIPQGMDVSLVLFNSSKKFIEFPTTEKKGIILDDRINDIEGNEIMPIFILKENTRDTKKKVEIRYKYEGVKSYGYCKIKK